MPDPEHNNSPLQSFIRMIGLICEPPTNFALFDKRMQLSWSSENFSGPKELPKNPAEIMASAVSGVLEFKKRRWKNCYLVALHIYKSDDVCFVLVQTPVEQDKSQLRALSYNIRLIQGCVAEVETYRSRLAENVCELRHFQQLCSSSVPEPAVENVEQEMMSLLSDCVDSMSLVGAFLYYREGRQLFSFVFDETAFESNGLSESRRNGVIQRELYKHTENRDSAFVLESSKKSGVSFATKQLDDLQILLCPLLDMQSQVSGAMVLVRTRQVEPFVKSDLRLAELMCEKAYRVLQSSYDQTSGFLNRKTFSALLQRELGDKSSKAVESSLLFLRLDKLDEVYSLGGVEAGLHVVSQLAGIMGKRVRSRDFAGRLNRDEFGLLLKNCKLDNAAIVAGQVLESISEFTFDWNGQALGIEANIGLVPLSAAYVSPENLLRVGEETIELAREAGKNRYAVFNGVSGKRRELSRIGWDQRIHRAVINNDFKLFCQPIVDTGAYGDGVQRYELLLRPYSDDGVLVAPYIFLSTARKLGMMQFVDRWVVNRGLALSGSLNSDSKTPRYSFTINLSGDSLNMNFAAYILSAAEQYSIVPNSVCFDITEDTAMRNIRESSKFIEFMRKRGFEFALDDFGVGIGAFSSLRNLPVDYVKLNGALVKNMSHDPVSESIVNALAQVCQSLGIKTIAELVENEAIRERLVKSGVNYIQGYEVGRPRAIESEFQDLINPKPSKAG